MKTLLAVKKRLQEKKMMFENLFAENSDDRHVKHVYLFFITLLLLLFHAFLLYTNALILAKAKN